MILLLSAMPEEIAALRAGCCAGNPRPAAADEKPDQYRSHNGCCRRVNARGIQRSTQRAVYAKECDTPVSGKPIQVFV